MRIATVAIALLVACSAAQSQKVVAPAQHQGGEEKLQMMAAPYQGEGGEAARRQETNTGMTGKLNSGVESISGVSMDDTKVDRDSPKSAPVQALTYTQATDLYGGPGQEKHLPHDARYVAQHKQGRVRPTVQLTGNQVKDGKSLEHEASQNGRKALQVGGHSKGTIGKPHQERIPSKNVARAANAS